MQLDRTRVEQEEKRKTLAAETQQHQKVWNRNLSKHITTCQCFFNQDDKFPLTRKDDTSVWKKVILQVTILL